MEKSSSSASQGAAAVHYEKQASQAGAVVVMAIPEMTVCGVWKAF